MNCGFDIGKTFGISIHIDWSWLLIITLMSWGLAFSFGQMHGDWTALTQWEVALLAALLFFISLLAHELAHSLVAQAQGIPVYNITLFMFGGASNIQKEPSSPIDELLVTIVGPLTSFFLGGFFLILSSESIKFSNVNIANVAILLSQLGPISTILLWLGSVNIFVGLFNLVPGFPLDGGRILRSILWAITDNLTKATRWASRMGQAIAWALILTGIFMIFGMTIPFLGIGFINGIWIILTGWFLRNAAVQGYRRIAVQDILEDVPVKQMMYTDVPVVHGDPSITKLVDDSIIKSDNRAFIVVDGGKKLGLVTIEGVRKRASESVNLTPVRDVMTPLQKMIVVAPDEEASEAFYRLESGDIYQLPVVEVNQIVGLLRHKDIVRWLQLQSKFGADHQLPLE